MTVRELVERFLRQCERKGCKPSSVRHYRGRLKAFVAEFGPRQAAKIAREAVLEHLDTINRDKSPSTIRANLVALELLQAFAVEFEHLPKPWTRPKDIIKPAPAKRERIATDAETRRIIAASKPDFALIYRVLRLTGARPGELCGAQIADLEGKDGEFVLVLADHKTARKTGKARRILVGPGVAPLVVQAIGERTEGPIFLDARGRPWERERLSRTFRRIRDALGLTRELVLYCTRHEFGTAVTRSAGIYQASKLLGHTDIKMTQRYAHMSETELRDIQGQAIKDVSNEPEPDAPPQRDAA